MQLLMNTKHVDGKIAHNTKEDTDQIHSAIRTAMSDYEKIILRVSSNMIAFGSEKADYIISTAEQWNDAIRQDVQKAIRDLEGQSIEHFKLDTNATHNLYLAARTADNMFSVYGSRGILADNASGWNTFSTIMTETMLNEIKKRPEEWILASVYVI